MIVNTNPVITERYARAFFHVAKSRDLTQELLEQAKAVLPLFVGGSPLRRFLEGPQIPTEDKQQLLKKVFGGKINPLLGDLFRLLVSKHRLEFFEPILLRFKVLVEEDHGLYEAEVATAAALNDEEKQQLQGALEGFTGSKLLLNYVVDPHLIGGVRFTYGDVLIDDTVHGKLYKLRQQLQEAAQAQA